MNGIFFYILVRSWKAFANFDRCVDSVFKQSYTNYKILFVDDCSGYNSRQKKHIQEKLHGHIVQFNKKRLYSLRNAYELLKKCQESMDTVVFNLDGDDFLPHRKCLEIVAEAYNKNKNCLLTWGGCFIQYKGKLIDKGSDEKFLFANLPYSKKVKENNLYRQEPFYPLHPRTWKSWLFKKINKKDFLRPDGSWLRFAEDQAIFFPMLEMAGGNFITIQKPIYTHNFGLPKSDLNSNLLNLVKDELIIRKKPSYGKLF